jgi:hypothetical protein
METFAASTLLTLHVFSFILVYRKDLRRKQATKKEKGGIRKWKEHGKKMWKEGRVKDKVVSKTKERDMSTGRTLTTH